MLKNKSSVLAVAAVLAGCAGEPSNVSDQSGDTVAAQQAIEDWGEVFPHVVSGPTLVQWQTESTAGTTAAGYEYGVRIQTEASGTVRIRFKGCTVDGVKRAFDLMRSNPQSEDTQWTWTVSCPSDSIPKDAKLIVEPLNEGYSYLEAPPGTGVERAGSVAGGTTDGAAGASGDATSNSTYLVIPNRCANLVKHFGITERAASLPTESTVPEWERDQALLKQSALIPLDCGNERMANQSTSELGLSQFGLVFSKRLAVHLRRYVPARGDTDVLFYAIDGEPVQKMASDQLFTKLKAFGAQIGATVSTKSIDGVESLDREPRAIPVGIEAWDLQISASGSGASTKPQHRRWGSGGKLLCLSGADPVAPADGLTATCDADAMALTEAWDVRGSRVVRLRASNSIGKDAAIVLPDCAAEDDAPNWKSLLGLGSVQADTRPWLDRMRDAYSATSGGVTEATLPCLMSRTCRVNIAAGTELSRQTLVRTSLNSKSLLAKCVGQCQGTCAEVELALTGDVSAGGDSAFAIDKDKLPAGMNAVRLFGATQPISIRVAEIAANKPDGTYVGSKPLPVVTVSGGVRVSLSNVRFVANESETSGKPRTPAPALARSALEVNGTSTARPTVLLNGVKIEGGVGTASSTLPLYEGLRVKSASVWLYGSQLKAYKRAVGVEDAEFSVIGGSGMASELRSGAVAATNVALTSMSLDGSGKAISLSGTAKNFPALELGANTNVFVGRSDIIGPLGLVWAGAGRNTADAEDAVFLDMNIRGSGTTGPDTMRTRALGMLINGSGDLYFAKLRVSNTYMPVECGASGASMLPRLQIVQETYSCVGTDQRYMTGSSLCSIEQSTNWERDENWPNCVDE